MSPAEFAVRRPITVAMVSLAAVIFGLLARSNLAVELLPDLSYPSLTIQTEYEDAAPVSVEQFVTRPIEEAVGVIPGVRDMRSVSRPGLSEVVLEFEWDEPMDFAAMEVREKLGLAELPREADVPRVLRFDPTLDPILRVAFAGNQELGDLRQLAERWIKPRLEAVRGVASAKLRGGLVPEITVEADEDRLAALGLTLDDLAVALRAENVNQPGGTLREWGSVYLVRTLHEFEDLRQIERTVVREGALGRVRVEDVARVRRGHKDRDEITRFGGQEVVELAIHREGSANTIAVAAAVREEIERLNQEMGSGSKLTVMTDQSTYIRDAVGQVWSAALLGGVLAVLVLYFFLRDALATAIIAISIPLSVVVAFLPMYRAGVTLNIMSLGGLALGVGMLVDNSIVVLEAIDRHRREGRSRADAARSGGAEVAGAVTASTLTTVSVFFPIVFVRGVAGQLFFDLAITVCFSLAASLVVSLTIVPALAAFDYSGFRGPALQPRPRRMSDGRPWTFRLGSFVLPPLGDGRSWRSRAATAAAFLPRLLWELVVLAFRGLGWLVRSILRVGVTAIGVIWWAAASAFHYVTWPLKRMFDTVGRAYPGILTRALGRRGLVLTTALILFVAALAMLPRLGTSLVPDLAQGEFAFRLRLPEGTGLTTTADIVGRIEERVIADPAFLRVFSTVGSVPSSASGRRTVGENLAQIDFALSRPDDAEAEALAIDRVRKAVSRFPAVEAELVHPSVLTVKPPVAINVFSDDLATLDDASATIARSVAAIPGVADITTTTEPGSPEITLDIDRERAADLGVAADELSRSLRRQIQGEVVGQFREDQERIDIRLRASEVSRDRAEDVAALRFRLPGGAAIPVSAVANVQIDRGPAAIHRAGGARVAQVTAKVSATDLGRILDRVHGLLSDMRLPGDAVAEMSGQDRELRVSFNSLLLALALAIFLVYVVMAVQFESVRYPFVILLSVPLGIVGVVAVLWVTGTPLNVLALIGAVMLAGIVVNNAIVLVDAILRRRREGQMLEPAIVAAGQERLRPIVMTTATTVLALLPMALGLGAGDELRRPLAITVIGGLTTATLLTLVVIPCLYRSMSGEQPVAADQHESPEVTPRAAGWGGGRGGAA